MRNRKGRRSGAAAVEFAVVASATLFLIFALAVGAMGIFRYQEVAHLAREGARHASTHGGQYTLDGMVAQTGVAAIASSDNMRTYLLSKTVLLDASSLTVTASWTLPSTYTYRNMPTYTDTNPNLVPPAQVTLRNYVTVTVSYQWMPEMYLVGPITLTSTSTMPMSY